MKTNAYGLLFHGSRIRTWTLKTVVGQRVLTEIPPISTPMKTRRPGSPTHESMVSMTAGEPKDHASKGNTGTSRTGRVIGGVTERMQGRSVALGIGGLGVHDGVVQRSTLINNGLHPRVPVAARSTVVEVGGDRPWDVQDVSVQ
jgi:hypothetical protein